ncbi:unnamed protein product [Medioppia subpectinata]|uniref:Exonuclease domain-containing protein n=1 Tax=Medioppia subpectinata TaxID=1979941 RepID=A0A7R9PUN6_9ACAR|nr:unnamed protein product [Medioppia subpectinata]CAG2100966.1 unnamed protein product [Medioppia subpectinata]
MKRLLNYFRINDSIGSQLRTTCRHTSWLSSVKSKQMAESGPKQQLYDYFLVLDFEATCDKPKQLDPMEIIEFPVVKVNAKTFESEEVFHRYVRPIHHPKLTPFCCQLTGIIDDMVADEKRFDVVLNDFNQWLHSVGLICGDYQRCLKKFTFVTCGEWDLQLMLPNQCQLLNLRIPLYLRTWVNVKKSYAEWSGVWPKSMSFMLEELKIKPKGRLHSGIDDCHNIVHIMKTLAQRGVVFKNTSSEW